MAKQLLFGEDARKSLRAGVDAVADAAALQQQCASGPAQVCAGQQRDAFLLGGERHSHDLRIGESPPDHCAVTGVRHVGEQTDVHRPQLVVEDLRPVALVGRVLVHGRYPAVVSAGRNRRSGRSCAAGPRTRVRRNPRSIP